MIELYIAGKKADIEQEGIKFTYQETDFTNPTAIRNSFTRDVRLPSTNANNDIFGHIYKLDRFNESQGNAAGANFNPSRKTDYALYVNGDIYQKGYLKLNSIQKNGNGYEYDCTLYGMLGDFFSNLSYRQSNDQYTDDRMKLSDLKYTESGGDDELDFKINKEYVKDSWDNIGDSIITFVPAYNGVPDDFSADRVLVDTENPLFDGIRKEISKDGKTFKTKNDFVLMELDNSLTEWEVRDLRSYLQRPAIKVSSIIEACCDPRNNGGYTVNLDVDFFNGDNPYWKDTYLTLPMLTEIDYEGDSQDMDASTDMELDISASAGTDYFLNVISESLDKDYGGVGSKTELMLEVNAVCSGVPSSISELSLSSAKFLSFNNYKKDVYFGSLYMQLIAYNGLTPVAASNTIELTSKVPTKPAFERGEEETYLLPDSSIYSQAGCEYIPSSVNPNIDRITGVFERVNGTDNWYFKTGTRAGRATLTFTLNGSSNYSSLKMRVFKAGAKKSYYDSKYTATNRISLYTKPSYSRNDLGGTAYRYQSVLEQTDSYITYSYGAKVRSNTLITKKKLLDTEYTPADYLIGYAKIFGLYFYTDQSEKEIWIHTRDNFYINSQRDIESLIDRDREISISPVTFDSKWLQMGYEIEDALYANDYENSTSLPFGCKRINTGYNFNSDTKNLLDIPYKGAVQGIEKSRYYTNVSGNELYGYFAGGMKYNLYSSEDSTEVEYAITSNTEGISGNYYDVFSKAQFHTEDNASSDGSNVLLFYNGMSDFNYNLTDDLIDMEILNESQMCWLFPYKSEDYINASIPMFGRYRTKNDYIDFSLDFGDTRQVYDPKILTQEGATIYDRYWKKYIQDLYDVDTKIMSCYIRLYEDNGNALMRFFWWFDNGIWRLNKLTDYDPHSRNTVLAEFVKVQDISDYTTNSEALPVKPVIPFISVSSTSSSVPSTGGTVFISVESNTSWSASTSYGVLSQPSGVGSTTISLNVGLNNWVWREITVSFTNDYQNQAVVFEQEVWSPSVGVDRNNILVPYGGASFSVHLDKYDCFGLMVDMPKYVYIKCTDETAMFDGYYLTSQNRDMYPFKTDYTNEKDYFCQWTMEEYDGYVCFRGNNGYLEVLTGSDELTDGGIGSENVSCRFRIVEQDGKTGIESVNRTGYFISGEYDEGVVMLEEFKPVQIDEENSWIVESDTDAMDLYAGWSMIAPDEQTLSISVLKNETNDIIRQYTNFVLDTYGNVLGTLGLVQMPEEIVFKKDGYDPDYQEDKYEILLPLVPSQYQIISKPDWLNVVLYDVRYGLYCNNNANGLEREGIMMIKNGYGDSVSVYVRQMGGLAPLPSRKKEQVRGNGYVYANASELCFPSFELSYLIEIDDTGEDSEWTLECAASWITLSATSGSGSGSVTITADDNGGEPRNAYVTLKSSRVDTNILLHQGQQY